MVVPSVNAYLRTGRGSAANWAKSSQFTDGDTRPQSREGTCRESHSRLESLSSRGRVFSWGPDRPGLTALWAGRRQLSSEWPGPLSGPCPRPQGTRLWGCGGPRPRGSQRRGQRAGSASRPGPRVPAALSLPQRGPEVVGIPGLGVMGPRGTPLLGTRVTTGLL